MRTPRAAAVRLLLLLLVVIAVVTVVVQAIHRPVGGETTEYHAEFGDVFGLQQNADVRLRGVQVGKVTGISLTADHRATVRFTLLSRYRLRSTDRIAVRFQNLTGQRYLAVTAEGRGAFLDPAQPVVDTVDSFDITTVFNGLRPLLREADPQVYNRFAAHLVAMVEGSDGDMAPLLRDLATLTAYAEDRTTVIATIVANLDALSQRLRGRSANLENILRVFHSIFMPVASRMEEFLSLMDKGSVEMTEIVRTAEALARLLLGARDSSDALTERIHQAIPDTTAAVRALSALPGLLEALNALIPRSEPSRHCSNGTVALPITAAVLLHGRPLTVCEGSR
ncbi:MlaD family protein [Nocardia implantans]|uniref:MlaD family protein n=1 Tax=Nocardia implantans TaxID=3108168 RepID=A0ABU6AXH0_9NOCA|nr:MULTISPECIES: MlaD family protein [unclassified Nocardia]MBF6193708.1 MCE family protein [Nocardia beijingensis]MEA3529554.1 MlaD family protein [Nocardia sp. CDC192]MEB3512140.1 MlaD family protein [Nocardia sp. CDC186]